MELLGLQEVLMEGASVAARVIHLQLSKHTVHDQVRM